MSKGRFSNIGLPLAKAYVHPPRRNKLLIVGGIAGLLVGGLLFADAFLRTNRFISNGPLTSSHAGFENDCQSCHNAFAAVSDDKCAACHDKAGSTPGPHTFDAHYIYRSDDPKRASRRPGETPCIGCHTEHLGRDAVLTPLDDDTCVSCHAFAPFERRHPPFDFAADEIPDSAALAFTHIRHIQELRKDLGIEEVQDTCSLCHRTSADGKSFQPIDFDADCARCHLGVSQRVRSANLVVREAGRPLLEEKGGSPSLNLGVETVEAIRQSRPPGQQWVSEESLAEYRERGGQVMKMRLRHEDPWIMYNLRELRRVLYPSAGLADLLDASADVPPQDVGILYDEAIGTLREYLGGLRGASAHSTVETETVDLERLLVDTQRKIREGKAPLDPSRFALGDAVNPRLAAEQVSEIEDFVQRLVEPCAQCHQIERATISRVRKDQRVLRRAEFNHRVHLLQRQCLDCHSRIPIRQSLASLAAGDKQPSRDDSVDNAAIQNLPAEENCAECHRSSSVSNACVTCHAFHPKEIN